MPMLIVIRGGGDLGSGVALRLHRAGFKLVISELPQPLAVRRLVSFSEAVYTGECSVEGVPAKLIKDPTDMLKILQLLAKSIIPVLIDPQGEAVRTLHPGVVIDARMLKHKAELIPSVVNLIIGLGPGFTAGENCHCAIETNRGHFLGRVLWEGSPEPDTGVPEASVGEGLRRVLRSSADGVLSVRVDIGNHADKGQVIAEVAGQAVTAQFPGVVRGLLRDGMEVQAGWKIGDLDPRDDARYCKLVSDKSLAIGGGVLEAILSKPHLRSQL